jgi:hypothetical protein
MIIVILFTMNVYLLYTVTLYLRNVFPRRDLMVVVQVLVHKHLSVWLVLVFLVIVPLRLLGRLEIHVILAHNARLVHVVVTFVLLLLVIVLDVHLVIIVFELRQVILKL